MKKLPLKQLILVISLALTVSLHAQVTIGSSQEPNKGALLDLKQDGTTTKGLALPRVKLTSLNATANNVATTIEGASGTWNNTDHLGLLVYHISEEDNEKCALIPSGIYIWDGDKWQSLQGHEVGISPDVSVFIDPRDGEQYKYRQFGTAGIWMLENMRATSYEQGGNPPTLGAPSSPSLFDLKAYIYPSQYSGLDNKYFEKQHALGLLYTWSAALNASKTPIAGEILFPTGVEQAQGGTNELTIGPQGICPNGWHVPSDREWNMLEKEIYENAHLYSEYKATDLPFDPLYPTWQTAWEEGETSNNPPILGGLSLRGSTTSKGHALALASQCAPPDRNVNFTPGLSKTANQGGFDALYAGGIFSVYGWQVSYWTASAHSESLNLGRQAWYRKVDNSYIGIARRYTYRNSVSAVRCKKD